MIAQENSLTTKIKYERKESLRPKKGFAWVWKRTASAVRKRSLIDMGFSPSGGDRVFFVTSVTWGRRALFQSQQFAELFLEILFHYRDQGCYQLHDFVLMPEHFHLIIAPAKTLSLEQAVQRIKGRFSYRIKKELGFAGEIWERSFSNHRIRDAEDHKAHRNYIELNPVKRALCSESREYQYSSANPAFVLDPLPQGLKPRTHQALCSQG